MQVFYGIDSRRLGFAELWRISPGAGFLVGAAMKLLHIRLKTDTAVPWLDGVQHVDEGTLPPDVGQAFAGPVGEWAALGFGRGLCYAIPMLGAGQRSFGWAHPSGDGTVVAQTFYAEKRAGAAVRRQLTWNCVSTFADGSLAGVTSSRRRLEAPPEFHMVSLPGASPGVLYRRHREVLAGFAAGPPLRIGPDGLEAFVVRVGNRAMEFHIQRGVYVPLETIAPNGQAR